MTSLTHPPAFWLLSTSPIHSTPAALDQLPLRGMLSAVAPDQ
ncbi:hypothetical protein SynBMKMC1_02665 [Synechococcus sp. BMK-MC-1]|nr:hypothetical protein SynBMKMC1_02665 [Synechococcus sp. BMK-MC-1]